MLNAVDYAAHWREKTAGAGFGHRAVAESYLRGIFFELRGPRPTLLGPPFVHSLVVAGDENVGHPPTPVSGRTSVMRVLGRALEDTAERLLDGALLVAECTRKLAHEDVGDNHRRQLAAGQDVAPD